MARKPTYEELELRIKELEEETEKRKQAEEALKESENRFRTLAEKSVEAIFLVNFDMEIVFWNPAAEEIIGLRTTPTKKITLSNVLTPDSLKIAMANVARASKTGTTQPRPYELTIRKFDGTLADLEVFIGLVEYDGKPHMLGTARNITERKQSEEALRESEEKYRFLVDNSKEIILILSKTGKILFANRIALISFGYSEEEIIGKSITKYLTKDSLKKALSALAQEFLGHPQPEMEIRIKAKSSEIRYLEVAEGSTPVHEKGKLIGVMINARDITEEKQAQEALKESEERFQQVAENAEEWIWEVDAHGLYTYASPVVEKILGYRPEEIVGKKHFYDLFHPEEREQFKKGAFEAFARRESFREFINRNTHKNGDIVWLSTSGVAILDGEGTLTGYRGVDLNITERMQEEEKLKESEERYRALVESSYDAILMMDNERRTVSCNQAFLDIFGYKKDELIGESIRIIHRSDKSFRSFGKMVYPVIEKDGYFRTEWEFKRKDGTILPVETVTSAIKSPDGLITGHVAIIRDITKGKSIQEALRLSNEKLLKEHNQRKILSKRLIDLLEKDRRQIAMELHDHIGQALTSLKMNLEMIHGKLKPDYTELGAQITAAKERTIQAIKDVKNISHGLRPAMIDALGVVSSLRELFNEMKQQMDIEIHFFSRGIPKQFEEGKELAIYRIAQEALGNIIRHAQAKNVFVNLVKKDEKLSLSVEDDGVGFDKEKVMKPTKKKGPLGLLIMTERAVQLDGEFTLESKPGKGTHLLVEIPI